MNNYNNKNIIYITLFFIFLVLILIEGYLCKYTKLNFCNESFFFNFWSENGFIEPLELGNQNWRNGRIISLNGSYNNISFLFLIITIVGGSFFSTSSGIRLVKLYSLFKFSINELGSHAKPLNVFINK